MGQRKRDNKTKANTCLCYRGRTDERRMLVVEWPTGMKNHVYASTSDDTTRGDANEKRGREELTWSSVDRSPACCLFTSCNISNVEQQRKSRQSYSTSTASPSWLSFNDRTRLNFQSHPAPSSSGHGDRPDQPFPSSPSPSPHVLALSP
jgi:hypothetical protein